MDSDDLDDDDAILNTIIDGTRRGKTRRTPLDIIGHSKTSTNKSLTLVNMLYMYVLVNV